MEEKIYQKNVQEANTQETQHPIITYTNRLQKQLDYVTSLVYSNQAITLQEKYALVGVIAILPPDGKAKFAADKQKLLSQQVISFAQYDAIFSAIHDWIYEVLLKEAFEKAKPTRQTNGKIEVTDSKRIEVE